MTVTDVAVVGAGPAGLATAIALAQRGVAVSVVERNPVPVERIGESVPAELRALLIELGAWPAFTAQGHVRSCGNASAWTDARLVRSDALRSRTGGGWHLDRLAFETMLRDRALAAGAVVRGAMRVVAVEPGTVHAITGHRTTVLPCRVLVDATGARASVARWLGACRVVEDRLVCAHARLLAPRARVLRERRALVESVAEGWWYATPLPGDAVLAALFCEPRTANVCEYRAPAAWWAALQSTRHVAAFVDAADREPARTRWPAPRLSAAVSHRLDRPAGRDWLAVGDAAAAVDPLASAGITVALRDGLAASAAISERLGGDHDALIAYGEGIRRRFAAYARQRRELYALPGEWRSSPFWRRRTRVPRDPNRGETLRDLRGTES